MFAGAISSKVHPATWAVVGLKHTALGDQIAHRGTAFALDAQGHLLTCWHVTYADKDCQVECDAFFVLQPEMGTAMYPATVLAKEQNRDVALLKITPDVKTQPLKLLAQTVPFGSSCCAFGHPLSVTDATTQSMRIFTRATAGIVSMPYQGAGLSAGGKAVGFYELDFFTHGGSSGAPVFRPNGDAFGWIRASLMLDDGGGNKKRSNLSVAVDIREAIEFLKPLNINLKIRWSL